MTCWRSPAGSYQCCQSNPNLCCWGGGVLQAVQFVADSLAVCRGEVDSGLFVSRKSERGSAEPTSSPHVKPAAPGSAIDLTD